MALEDEITEAAANPKVVTSDGTSVQGRDLRELIEADQHLANEAARTRTAFPIRMFHTRPPASTGRVE